MKKKLQLVPKAPEPEPAPDPNAYRRSRTYRDVILIVAHEIWNRKP